MSDSQKPPREWTLEFDSNFDDHPPAVVGGPAISGYEGQVEVIEKNAYDQLMQQALAMREALEEIYNDTKAEHGIHESEIKSWDSSSLGNVKGALEQFDEFMKKAGVK